MAIRQEITNSADIPSIQHVLHVYAQQNPHKFQLCVTLDGTTSSFFIRKTD